MWEASVHNGGCQAIFILCVVGAPPHRIVVIERVRLTDEDANCREVIRRVPATEPSVEDVCGRGAQLFS